jgi:L-asparaginase/Glu-tRNA(Gln) amidotransferase subunit D
MRSTAASLHHCYARLRQSDGGVRTGSSAELPVVVVLSTGGTIAGRGGSSTSLTEYKSGSILGSELVDAVPEIKQHATVRVEQNREHRQHQHESGHMAEARDAHQCDF